MLVSIRGQTLRNLPESIRSHVLPPGRQTTMPVRTVSEVRVGLKQGLGGHPVNTCIRTWTASLATRGFCLPPAEFPTTENDKSLTHGQTQITVCWLPLLILQHPLDNNHPPVAGVGWRLVTTMSKNYISQVPLQLREAQTPRHASAQPHVSTRVA